MKKAFSSFSQLVGFAVSLVIAFMMLLTVADVLGRFLFRAPITGTPELTEFMMIVIVFPALAWCALAGRHVLVDLIIKRFSPSIQAFIKTITLLLSLLIYVILTIASFYESIEVNTKTGLLRIPHAPFYWIMSLGFALFCVAILVLLVRNMTETREVKK